MSEKWRKGNSEKALACAIAWKKSNPEKVKAYNKKWREKNPEYMKKWKEQHPQACNRDRKSHKNSRDGHLKRNYNIGIEEYNQIFIEQNGKCAICGIHQSELKKALAVDHCHDNNKVRGLLCTCCNLGIGCLKDDIENLRCAILYLNKDISVR